MNALTRFWHKISPFNSNLDRGEKYSRILFLGLSVLAIFNLYDFVWSLFSILKNNLELPWNDWLSLCGFLVLPFALLLFIARKTIGWILIGAFLCFILFSFTYNFLLTLAYGPSLAPEAAQVNTLDIINFRLLFYMLLTIAALALLFTNSVKTLFQVKPSQAFGVLLFGGLLIALLLFTYFA